MNTRHWVAVAAGVAAVVVATAFTGPRDYEYSIVTGGPERAQAEVNDLARKGWEPVGMGAGGAMVLDGEGNSATNYGGRMYILMRRKR